MAAAVAERAPGTFRWSSLVPYAVLALWTLPIIVLYVWLFYSSFFPRIEGFRPIGAFTFDNWRFLWDPQSVPQMRNRPAILPLTLNTFIFAAMTKTGLPQYPPARAFATASGSTSASASPATSAPRSDSSSRSSAIR